jgi:23S rRNA (adenine2030-N6)-methyltransferase
MNYRHAYHAGNFADVLKHTVLVLCLAHLRKKDAPFRVIDTHAGPGSTDLTASEAEKTGEWRDGIGQVIGAGARPLPTQVAARMKPYLDLVTSENAGHMPVLKHYPGSPQLAVSLLRSGDTLYANEMHHEDNRRLAKLLASDRQVKVTALDGWTALKSLLPPAEKRGLVLIDPPFEEPNELIRLTTGLSEGLARFRSGIFLLWYPIKDPKPIQRFHRGIIEAAHHAKLESVMAAELYLRAPRHPDYLNGTGLIIANPPFTLKADLDVIMPELAARFSKGPGATHRVEDLLSQMGSN